MSNIFCTLAIGEYYARLAAFLVADLETYQVPTVVVTDMPKVFKGFSRVKVIEHHPKTFSYHDKRIALKEALKLGDTAVFVDADTAIWFGADRRAVRKALAYSFPPGLHSAKLSPPGYYDHPHIEAVARQWGLEFDRNIISYWEGLFALTKDDNMDVFFQCWQRFAEEAALRGDNGAGEGTCFGIAAEVAGLKRNFTINMMQSTLPYLLWHTRLVFDKRKLYHWKFGVIEAIKGNINIHQHCWALS